MGTTPSNTLAISVSDPSGYEYDVQFESTAFAEGQHRQCYLGTLHNPKAPKHDKKIVLKVFKPEYVEKHGADYACVQDLERSIICHEYCTKFNRAMKDHSESTMPIAFPAPLRINIKRAKHMAARSDKEMDRLIKSVFNEIPIKLNRKHKYLTCHPYLQNNDEYAYSSITSNNGWLTHLPDYRFVTALSHFSWAESKGKLLITGFQGIQRGHVLFLSDAVVHTDKVGKHGSNDLGVIGMVNFFLNHECNECCKHLPSLNTTLLIEYLSQECILKRSKARSYTFEFNEETLQKDEANIEQIYAESLSQTFAVTQGQKECAAETVTQTVTAAGDEPQTHEVVECVKMEQIEHVVETMNHDGIVEEEQEEEQEQQRCHGAEMANDEESEPETPATAKNECELDQVCRENQKEREMTEEVEVISSNLDVSWFGQEDEDNESYAGQKGLFDLDAHFVDVEQDADDAEAIEWELID